MSQVKANSFTDASGGSNAVLYGVAAPANSMGFRNRIINGDMRIDQRNAGASVTGVSGNVYTVDRFFLNSDQASKFSAQQVTDAPTGFVKSLKVTSSSAYSVPAGEVYDLQQRIEGFNMADLMWGTATAATVTLSFWAKSSLTGTFGGAFRNAAGNRSYPFTYTISSANTWEQKSVTVVGDTTGTWPTDNTNGVSIIFGLGIGTTNSGTAGAWAAAGYYSATGATSVVGTNGATFYITGVQLEAGSVASPFERRDYGRELMMCQRYYWKNIDSNFFVSGYNAGGLLIYSDIFNPVNMRAIPTSTLSGFANSNASNASVNSATRQRTRVQSTITSTGAGYSTFDIASDSEL